MRRLLICLSLCCSFNAVAELTLESPRVRAMPPSVSNTAAFFTVHNSGQQDIRLTSVSTPAASNSEFHRHAMSDSGVMSMSRVHFIDIKAGQSFEFNSGGHHIMLMGLHQPLRPGERIQLILQDNNKIQYPFEVPVMSIMAAQQLEKNNHPHH
ncbi:MAG: copper chaperone PCu(A)C [Bermanella sp.]